MADKSTQLLIYTRFPGQQMKSNAGQQDKTKNTDLKPGIRFIVIFFHDFYNHSEDTEH